MSLSSPPTPFVPSAAPVAPAQPVATPAPKRPAQDGQQGGSTPVQVSQHPPGGHPKADGGQWLSTSQAVVLSKARGGPDNVATLKRWGKRGRLEAIGMNYCPHGSKDNSLASFEDLLFPTNK